MRRCAVAIALAVALILAGIGGEVSAADRSDSFRPVGYRQPNLIFIMADDLGRNLLPLYDLDEAIEINTPNIDRLAAEGVVFRNAYASPLCIVTRTQLITGQYPYYNGMLGHPDNRLTGGGKVFLDPKYLRSFAQPLQEAGYATAVAGKWHGTPHGLQKRVLHAFGFDKWIDFDPDNQAPADLYTSEAERIFLEDTFPPDALFDFVADFITDNRDRPFFVYYPMHLVHRPFVATPLKPDAATNSEKLIAMVEYADHLIGRLLDTLDEQGLRDNTILFFSGDNGTALWRLESDGAAMLAGGKAELTEDGINVPFIVSGGPVIARGETDALTDFTDVLPTLAEFAGAEVPPEYRADGQSIAPFLTGRADDTPRQWIAATAAVWPTFGDAPPGSYGISPEPYGDRYDWSNKSVGVVVRDARYKLWDYRLGPRALFDLHNDPDERVNLLHSDDPEAAQAKHKLMGIRYNAFPGFAAPLRLDPIASGYGLFSHWRFDQQTDIAGQSHFPDSAGGYHLKPNQAADSLPPGKFGSALRTSDSPAEVGWFRDFFKYNKWHVREQDFSGFTFSAWLKRDGPPTRDWTLLTQPGNRWLPDIWAVELRAVVNGVAQDPPIAVIPGRRGGSDDMPGIRITAIDPRPRKADALITVVAFNLHPSQSYRIHPVADASIPWNRNCGDQPEPRPSPLLNGVTTFTWTYKVSGCASPTNVLALSITQDGRILLESGSRSVATPPRQAALADNEWMHVAATWQASPVAAGCDEATLYVNGKAAASSCLPNPQQFVPLGNLLVGGAGASDAYIDDLAVWRQALTPDQVAGLYTLGNNLGCTAAEVDTLFNAPREYPVAACGREWERTNLLAATPSGQLAVVEGPEGALEIHFGDSIAVRSREVQP